MGRPRQRRRRRAGNRPALDIPGTPSGGSHETSLLHAVVLAVGWGVLAFGAGYTWAYGPLLVFCATVGVVGLLSSPGMPHRAFAVALAAVVLAGALQVAPLPSAVVKTLSPARDTLEAVPERDFRPFDRFDPVRFRTGWPVSLSVAPSRTLLGLLFLTSLAIFLLGCARGFVVVSPRGVARSVVVLGLVVALIGIIQRASASDLVYGFWSLPYAMRPSAPFINGNHFAGWMLMAVSLSLGAFAGDLARVSSRVKSDWRSRILWLSSPDASKIVLTGFAIVIMALAIVLSLSRSGIGSLAVGALVFGVWVIRRRAGGAMRFVVASYLLLAVVIAAGWGGLDLIVQEFAGTTLAEESRLEHWRDAARIVGDFSLTGTGLNTYGVAMLGYQTYGLDHVWVEAHNDYLQLAAEGGLLMGGPILVALVCFAHEVRRRFRECGADPPTYWLKAGAVTGLVAVAIQSTVDFTLQKPGAAALFCVLAAIALHRSEPHGPGFRSPR